MKITLLIVTFALISSSYYCQLEILIGRSQPIGGFANKKSLTQSGFAKQGMSFQFSGGGQQGKLAMSYSVFATSNKFNVEAYKAYLKANSIGTQYVNFDIGKYHSFGMTVGPEYLLEINDKFIVPIKAHVGFHIFLPPLTFKGFYVDPYSYSGELSYDNLGGSWVYEVLGLNYRVGSGFGYKLDGDITLMSRVEYNDRFAGGQMTYGSGNTSATYPKKFKNVDINFGLFINL